MKVLVVGGGGREHALCWKLRQSPLLSELYCAPGNPGIGEIADLVPLAVDEIHRLAEFASDIGIDLTVVGPELPLTFGIVDEFQSRGLRIFGPRQNAAELEGSKVFAKQLMERHGVPTGAFRVAHDASEAEQAVAELGLPVVLKANGLAAGKGVLIVRDREELEEALSVFFVERRFGTSGERVVVEEHLTGDEVSFMVLSDGEHVLPLATARDYKRLLDGDEGPNTGGMGCHSPSGGFNKETAGLVMEAVVRPIIAGLAAENRTFQGVLYAGLMLTDDGPKVLEFNTRFGDPEAQAILMRLEDDLLPVLAAGAEGGFSSGRLHFKKEAAACVVLASAGYPARPVKGEEIDGLERLVDHPGVQVFHAGTAIKDGRLVSAGGRVLDVCATGVDLRDALRRAYNGAAEIVWPSKVLRRDIGRAVLESR